MPQATLQPRRGLWARLEALTDTSDQPTGRPELRDQLWWPATRHRWVITAVAVTGLVLILVATPLINWVADPEGLEQACAGSQTRCGAAANVVVAVLAVVAGYLYIFYIVRRRAVRRYVRTARDRPHRLLPAPPHGLLTGTTISRDDTCRLVARRLRHASGAGAQLVVGEAGSGKTTFLRELTSYLADRGAVPVVVPLRSAQLPLSFPVLARQRFFEEIDADVHTEDEADRIWRTLRKERSIVVLADGLDEVVPELSMNHRGDVIRRALNEARYQDLPLVVTCRTGAMPLKSSYAEVDLRPLTPEEARKHIDGRVASRKPEPHELAKRDEIIDVKGVGDTPFYLNIVAELLRADRLDIVTVPGGNGTRQRDDLRIHLLDTLTQALADGAIHPAAPLQATASVVINELARIAGAMTFRGVLEITEPALQEACQELSTSADPLVHDLSAVVEDGTRLGLMQALVGGGGTTIRFSHAILQVYFTERLLTDDARRPSLARRLAGNALLRTLAMRCGWREQSITTTLIERTASNELLRALTIWCDKTGNGERERVATELCDRAGACRDDAALRLVVTGMEILSPLGDDAVRTTFEQAADQAFDVSGRAAKLAAIERLGELSLPCVYDLLLDLGQASDQDHGVRLQAARTLAAGGETAYLTVRESLLGRDLTELAAEASQGDESAFRALTVLGWVLPCLATGTREGPLAEEARAQVRALAGLVRNGVRLDLEASIAQGFKLDALANPKRPVDDLALDLLGQFNLLGQFKARFWFSRIMLLQAVCVRTAGQRPANRNVTACIGDVKTRPREHPFVREAARLCREAVRKHAWEHYVWTDESEAVAGSGGILDPAATELLADIALLLNLMEHGNRAEHLARLVRTNDQLGLPYCMSESRTRAEFTTFCKGSYCRHGLCPYPDHLGGSGGMGPLSEAFCRDQSSHRSRSRGLPIHRPMHRSGVRRMSRRASRQFWDQMAERGRMWPS